MSITGQFPGELPRQIVVPCGYKMALDSGRDLWEVSSGESNLEIISQDLIEKCFHIEKTLD